MKHAEIKADRVIAPTQATRADLPSRTVWVENDEYLVQLKPSTTRIDHRFETKHYAVVQLPGQWNAVVSAPDGIDDVHHLWYRELAELVERAKLYVHMRKSA